MQLPLEGIEQPTVSFNLSSIADWATQQPFIDLVKSSRAWTGQDTEFNWVPSDEVDDVLEADEDGWPVDIPDDFNHVALFWAWDGGQEQQHFAPEYRAGRYILEHEGEGTIEIPNAQIHSEEDGRIVFEIDGTSNLEIRITETDPSNEGDYLRNIAVFREEHEELLDIGAVFNPDWIHLIEDSAQLRFMEWMRVNDSSDGIWNDRTHLNNVTYATEQGPPVEVMVLLANQIGADPWFTMPQEATEEYIRNFAEYVGDNLDPELKAHVELGNEAWNTAFPATQSLIQRAELDWGETGGASNPAYLSYQSKLATEMATIWKDVFADDADSRLVTVLGTFASNSFVSEQLIEAPLWLEHEPEEYVDPSSVFDALGTTTYFGAGVIADPQVRSEFLTAIDDPEIDINQYLFDMLGSHGPWHGLPDVAEELEAQSVIADQHDLSLIAYEGGQHVHHLFAVQDISDEEIASMQSALAGFVRSDEMAQLYRDLWDIWSAASDGPFMQFTDVDSPTKFGSWGLYDALDDESPRSNALAELNQNSSAWWDASDRSETAFLQGRTEFGTDGDDEMFDTEKMDFLVGGHGDDILHSSGGDDGIHGGAGHDALVVDGDFVDYSALVGDDGAWLSGPGGDIRVVDVETVNFRDGFSLLIEDPDNVRLISPDDDSEPPQSSETHDLGAAEPSNPEKEQSDKKDSGPSNIFARLFDLIERIFKGLLGGDRSEDTNSSNISTKSDLPDVFPLLPDEGSTHVSELESFDDDDHYELEAEDWIT
ncbi:calcium-binding protein [Cognatishimia sp. MH4019]|uniref:calcium-binding protein n=1 Tax=Cognatishimia sp. MH4019 TaxID=2854030 RepID=UPI001CD5B37D|nr:hypothetical protein [Cognatishimia sp. MH4019]